MRSFRQLTTVVALAAMLTPTLIVEGTAAASTHHRHRPAPKAHQASPGDWSCTLVGGVVAAGVGASVINPGLAAITAVLSGSSFTAGCLMGANRNPRLISGLPRGGNCWYVWQHHRGVPHRHRAYVRRVEECWA